MKTFAVVFALLFAFAVATEISQYPGRSGQIILAPENIQDGSILLLFNNDNVIKINNFNTIDEISVADLIGHLLGTPILNEEASRASFPSTNIFNKPSANLMVAIDGVDSETLVQFVSLTQRGKQLSVNRIAYPQDSIASLVTLISGQTPSAHGIINKSWKVRDHTVYAFKSATSHVSNIADVVSETFSGKALTLSVSGDFQMAAAMAVHQSIQAEHPSWSNQAIYFNHESNRFESTFGNDELGTSLKMSRSQILTTLTEMNSIQFAFNDDTNTLSVLDATFDLSNQDDMVFFGELTMVYSLSSLLTSDTTLSPLVSDNVPDMYNVAISSLKNLERNYGKNSAQMNAAVELLNSALTSAINQLNELYNSKLTSEVLFMAPSAYTQLRSNAQLKKAVYPVVESYVSKEEYEAYFPVVFLGTNSEYQDELCSAVTSRVSNINSESDSISVYCPVNFESFWAEDKAIYYKSSNSSDSTTLSSSQEFQIVLWISILLALVLGLIMYAMCTLGEGDDSLLYRATSKKSA